MKFKFKHVKFINLMTIMINKDVYSAFKFRGRQILRTTYTNIF